ncbi:MAG: cytochrome P450 [Burkholderiales bacterium]|nr:cytochrome P450 [Burkholderiales bacterium]
MTLHALEAPAAAAGHQTPADTALTVPTLARALADLRDPAWLTAPREQAARLRERGRVHRDTQGLWLLLGHADCRAVMQSARLSRDPRQHSGYAKQRPFVAGSALEHAAERFMLFNDAPVHTRLRRVVAAAFTPVTTRTLRESVAATARALVATLPADGTPFDFMRDFAQVLPIRVICDLLGIDAGDFDQAKAWSDAAARVVEPLASRTERAEGARAVAELTAFLEAQVARRRVHPGDTVLDRMIAAQRDEPAFDDDELLANLILLFVAGHETTTNLLGNGLLALLRHPDQFALLRSDPATLLPSAVEEMLRYESPTNMVARITIEPWTIRDLTVPAGEALYCMVGAANHDPAVFVEPGRFDIRRNPNPQLAFGGGVHYCVGAPLARLEAEVAFEALLQRFGTLALVDEEIRWRPMINLRGLQALHLRGQARS